MLSARATGHVGHCRAPMVVLQRVISEASCQEPGEEAVAAERYLATGRRPDRTERRRSRQYLTTLQINLPVHHPMDPGCDQQDGADCPRYRSRTDSSFFLSFWCIFVLIERDRDTLLNESIPRIIRCNQFNSISDIKRTNSEAGVSVPVLFADRADQYECSGKRSLLVRVCLSPARSISNRSLLQENQRKICHLLEQQDGC